MAAKRRRVSPLQFCILLYGSLLAILDVLHFPYSTDPAGPATGGTQASEDFYKQAYTTPVSLTKVEQEKEDAYALKAKSSADQQGIPDDVRNFVRQYHLENKHVLEVGAGQGYLQDVVDDYTGLDISPTARRYFHKPFVAASATAMPFKDGEFDAIWSIWVLEHIPNPESALREMRRVVKPGGVIFLAPAWQCPPWAAQGYEVRPYSAFGIPGKIIKASIPMRSSFTFQFMYIMPVRFIRYAETRLGGPSAFHYRRLEPNYETYWTYDADAVNSMDPYEAALWFETRGDKCLNCTPGLKGIAATPGQLVLQVTH